MVADQALPIIPTMGVGSYAAPGWFLATHRLLRDNGLGPIDIDELMEDATRIVVSDQQAAGIDIYCDGELRRQRFVYEMYDRLAGLKRRPPRRRLGIAGYDMAPSFILEGKLAAPDGFGLVEDYLALRRILPDAPVKIALPGALTFANSIALAEGQEATDLLDELVGLLRTELTALIAAGADYIQVDEPRFSNPPYGLSLADGAAVINATVDGLPARTAVHVCFGNNAGRPMADRRFAPLLTAMQYLRCDQLILEFANRQMGEIDLMADLSQSHEIACGVIDVKNFRIETAEDVARQLEICLRHIPADRLTATADCGYSALPRYIARAKQQALVAGTKLVRGRL